MAAPDCLAASWTATTKEVMLSRYLRYQTCMDRSLGRNWWKRAQLYLGMNRWVNSEMTQADYLRAPADVKAADARCRSANELAEKPRPITPNPLTQEEALERAARSTRNRCSDTSDSSPPESGNCRVRFAGAAKVNNRP